MSTLVSKIIKLKHLYAIRSITGQTTEQKCEQWPRQKCTKEQKVVTKYSPETSCDQVSRELCAPKKCKESAVSNHIKQKLVLRGFDFYTFSVKFARIRLRP